VVGVVIVQRVQRELSSTIIGTINARTLRIELHYPPLDLVPACTRATVVSRMNGRQLVVIFAEVCSDVVCLRRMVHTNMQNKQFYIRWKETRSLQPQ